MEAYKSHNLSSFKGVISGFIGNYETGLLGGILGV